MSSFSLVISPPDRSRASFTENSASPTPLRAKETWSYVTLRSATMPYGILSFGSWLEPRYIFAAGQLN